LEFLLDDRGLIETSSRPQAFCLRFADNKKYSQYLHKEGRPYVRTTRGDDFAWSCERNAMDAWIAAKITPFKMVITANCGGPEVVNAFEDAFA